MFTGIVEHVGRVLSRSGSSAGAQLSIDLGPCAAGVRPGDSIAVNGACLTLTSSDDATARFDVGPETLARTTVGDLRMGDAVHLERALQVGGRLDGHLVQGHVDCVGDVRRVLPRGQATDLTVEIADQPLHLVVEKGSIAIAGVSLTVNRVQASTFDVSLVPFTQGRTTLASLRTGARVNIEFDVIGRYVARLLGQDRAGGQMSIDFLKEHGFA